MQAEQPENHADTLFDLSDQPLLLSVEETAALLRCSPREVSRKVQRGELVRVKHGHFVRIPRESVRLFLIANLERAADDPARRDHQ